MPEGTSCQVVAFPFRFGGGKTISCLQEDRERFSQSESTLVSVSWGQVTEV